MKEKISFNEVLNIFTNEQVNKFIKKHTNYTLDEKKLSYEMISNNWHFLGNNNSNASSIGILAKGEKGLIERLTNAIDAVIEKQKELHEIINPKNSELIVKKGFPKFYERYLSAKNSGDGGIVILDAENQVVLVVNDGSQNDKPTFDIVDQGIGVQGKKFEDTFLSLSGGNKLSSDKKYLIGAFGQGGSTSLPFTNATIIISKNTNKFFFTVIKSVDLIDYKNSSFMFLKIDNEIPELFFETNFNYDLYPKYISDFLKSESGTLVRMIETDISKEFRDNDATKPAMLIDYLNTELFNTLIPIKVIENRKKFENDKAKQNRYAYGSRLKLSTWKREIKQQYTGTINIEHQNKNCKIDFFAILPQDESKWSSDAECKKNFKRFNTYCDPIIYTVNGQTICTEKYEKLKTHTGFTFLKYRLLIIINLDDFDNDKYKFFTSDRAKIKSTDLTRGFLNKILKNIANNEKIKELNEIIGQKSITNTFFDEERLDELANEVKNIYTELLKTNNQTLFLETKHHIHFTKSDEDNFLDSIEKIQIISAKNSFYSNESIKFTLETKAKQKVNKQAKIYAYINNHEYRYFNPSFMNGRIIYLSNAKTNLSPQKYQIYFALFKKDNQPLIESQKFNFEILAEKSPDELQKNLGKNLGLQIIPVKDKELICEIERSEKDKDIKVYLCLDHILLSQEIYNRIPNVDSAKISEIKNEIITPIVLFSLLLKDVYQKTEEKNELIISLTRTMTKILKKI